ncbi:MAG: TM2 domain-containing protein [Candidatus Gracilibacteria bacterium]|nr:TM2 domain-containing protein [Candidatus Gracilibacteria bacterium]MDQ7022892.1 TM2 domain-containing protein [Candidatus Gracilibacteria bacterium]
MENTAEKKFNQDWIMTMVLWFLLGMLGIHRFYNGKIITGILMILTLGGLGIWWLIDGIFLIMGKFTKKDGTIIKVKI